ncbi:prepilin peptidase [Serinicoccus kebangsaanensis]|uniref:prepilin peptidase n=1 Tax=Serinicoccus kebangsaanensis TaxID=2602069 RepID=UPI00124F76DC|nr:A24 family peptidase [Serinicoccus kebangsaanensis]
MVLAAAALLGAVVGEILRRVVVRGAHRLEEEQDLPRRSAWLLVPGTALSWAWITSAWWPENPWLLGALLLLTLPLLWLAAVDADVERLPDRVTLPLLLVVAAAITLVGLVEGGAGDIGRALLAGLALGAFYGLLVLVGRGAMGGGDVKLAPSLGMLLGYASWAHVILGTVATFLGASAFGVALVLLRRAGRTSMVAFGPHMIAATLLLLGFPA